MPCGIEKAIFYFSGLLLTIHPSRYAHIERLLKASEMLICQELSLLTIHPSRYAHIDRLLKVSEMLICQELSLLTIHPSRYAHIDRLLKVSEMLICQELSLLTIRPSRYAHRARLLKASETLICQELSSLCRGTNCTRFYTHQICQCTQEKNIKKKCKISPQGKRFLTQSFRTTPISLEDRTEDGDIFTHCTPGLTRLGETYGILNSLQLLLPRLSSAHSRTFLLTFIHTFIQSQLSHATFSQAQPTTNSSLIHFVLF